MNTIAPSDIPLPRIRRKRRIAVLALRLPRFLPHAVPAAASAKDGGGTAHACNTELTSNCVYGCQGSSST